MIRILLLLAAASSPVRIAVLGDRTGGPDDAEFELCLRAVSIMAPDMVATVGDLVEGYTEDEGELEAQWDHVLDTMAGCLGDLPVLFVPGNHDITWDSAEPAWRARTGTMPERVQRMGGVDFVVWDTSRDERLDGDALGRLRALLGGVRPSDTAVLVTHRPFWMLVGVDAGMVAELRSMIAEADIEVVLGGHIHTYAWESRDGVEYITMGTSGGDHGYEDVQAGCFPQVGWLTLDGDEVSFALLDPRSAYPMDLNTVSEENLLYMILHRLLSPRPLEEALESSSLTLDPVEGVERRVELRVDPAGWGFRPESVSVLLTPGRPESVHFSQNPVGGIYPPPVIHVTVPYGDRGKVADFDTPWPVMRSAGAPPSRVTVDGTASPGEYPGRPETVFAAEDGGPSGVGPTAVHIALSDGMLCFHGRMAATGGMEDESFAVVLFAGDACWRVKAFPDGGAAAIRYSEDGVEDWEGGWLSAAGCGGDAWEAEIGIDLERIGATGQDIRAHIYRLAGDGWATWAWPLDFEEEAMGWIRLGSVM